MWRIRYISSSVGCNKLPFEPVVCVIHSSFDVIEGEFDGIKFEVLQEDMVVLAHE